MDLDPDSECEDDGRDYDFEEVLDGERGCESVLDFGSRSGGRY